MMYGTRVPYLYTTPAGNDDATDFVMSLLGNLHDFNPGVF